MNTLINSLKNVFHFSPVSAPERDEAYLAGSADLAELELRMRQIDQHSRAGVVDGPYGLFIR
jgi:Protein of unknown function (DUF3563)